MGSTNPPGGVQGAFGLANDDLSGSFSPTEDRPAIDPGPFRKDEWRVATVVSSDPSTYTIDVDLGEDGHVMEGIPLMQQSGAGPGFNRGGTDHLPMPGASAVLSTQLSEEGFPLVCIGFITGSHENPLPNPTQEELLAAPSVDTVLAATAPVALDSYGAEDPLYKLTGADSHRGGRAGDVAPGDWQQVGTDGNALAVLEGGVSVFKASDLAQILGFKLGDLIRIVARNFELITDFGILRMVSDGGRAKVTLKANTDTLMGHPGKEGGPVWNIEASLGDEDNAFQLKLTNPDNSEKATITITDDGDITISGRSVNIKQGRLQDKERGTYNRDGHNINTSYTGNEWKKIKGDFSHESRDILLDSGRKFIIRAKSLTTTTSDKVDNIQHKAVATVQGAQLDKDGPPVPGFTVAKETNVVNGDYRISVGKPPLGNPLYASSFRVDTYTGSILLQTNIKGSVVIGALGLPDEKVVPFGTVVLGNVTNQIMLGAPLGPPPLYATAIPANAVVKFNELATYLTTLHGLLDSHIHPCPVGTAPAPIFSGPLGALIAPMMSQVVKLTL